MCEREHLAVYTFKEAFLEADILWFRDFFLRETKQTIIKESEHLQILCGTKVDGLPKQHKLADNVF